MSVRPAIHGLKARPPLSLCPRTERIVDAPQMCAEGWIVAAATTHRQCLDPEQDPVPASRLAKSHRTALVKGWGFKGPLDRRI